MTDSIVQPDTGGVNGLDFEPDDALVFWRDDEFREDLRDALIEAQQRQDAQVSRAERDYLRGGH